MLLKSASKASSQDWRTHPIRQALPIGASRFQDRRFAAKLSSFGLKPRMQNPCPVEHRMQSPVNKSQFCQRFFLPHTLDSQKKLTSYSHFVFIAQFIACDCKDGTIVRTRLTHECWSHPQGQKNLRLEPGDPFCLPAPGHGTRVPASHPAG